jgi:hypothetical protein
VPLTITTERCGPLSRLRLHLLCYAFGVWSLTCLDAHLDNEIGANFSDDQLRQIMYQERLFFQTVCRLEIAIAAEVRFWGLSSPRVLKRLLVGAPKRIACWQRHNANA